MDKKNKIGCQCQLGKRVVILAVSILFIICSSHVLADIGASLRSPTISKNVEVGATPAHEETKTAKGNGQLKLEFTMPKDKTYRDIATVFKASEQFQLIIDGLNQEFILPYNILVEFADKDGPLYDPETKTITMSYSFILYFTSLYLERYPKASDDEMITFAIESTTFLFYHELAHSLIDAFELPIVSNEETAADNLAVILTLEYTNDGYEIAMNSAELFDMMDQTNKVYDEDELWDEHALDSQRFYNILCLTYGRYPEKVLEELKTYKNKKMLKFIEEKGEYCEVEYHRQFNNWFKLLDPHLRSE